MEGIPPMVFSSILFMYIYLPAVLAVYYIVPSKWRNIWLFIVNLVFYGWGEPVYILLMLFSICVNYYNGRMIEKHRAKDKVARRFLIANIVINLALLMFFKYFDLFAETISLIPGVLYQPAWPWTSHWDLVLHVPDHVLSHRCLSRRR